MNQELQRGGGLVVCCTAIVKAGLLEDDRTVAGEMLVESNAVAGTVREIGELILAPLERLLAEIEAIELDQVEGAEQSGMVETANADNIPKFAMALGSLGNVRTRTVRAWPEAEMSSKPAKRPKLLAAIQICKRSWPSFFGNVRPSPANWQ